MGAAGLVLRKFERTVDHYCLFAFQWLDNGFGKNEEFVNWNRGKSFPSVQKSEVLQKICKYIQQNIPIIEVFTKIFCLIQFVQRN